MQFLWMEFSYEYTMENIQFHTQAHLNFSCILYKIGVKIMHILWTITSNDGTS